MQWYYNLIKAYIHFVPLKEDLSDLIDQLQWVKSHDNEAKQIADNATRFVLENLNPDCLYMYLFLVLVKLSIIQEK